jgi:16S rRNA (cytosine967-C5)-methyltransferase
MRAGARLQAAIEVLSDMEARKRPAADALKDWALTHRFAGSKDRSAIGDLVFGALRWKASSAWRLSDDTPRAWVFGAAHWGFGVSAEDLAAQCADPHAPAAPSAQEMARLRSASLGDAPPFVRGDYPDWLDESFARAFGETRAEEGAALAAPAPLDLRANALKTDRDAVIAALAKSPRLAEPPQPAPYAPHGVRIPWAQGRSFPWASKQAFVKGWFEVQDEGSQLAALLCGAQAGMQVVDMCAGGGGKTLALAAMMGNSGQIYAFDIDGRRLAPLKDRLDRAGVRNVQIRPPARDRDVLADLKQKADIVLVDAPCTGSGTWRRAPDSKWRLRPNALAMRQSEQRAALALAAPLVKPGGALIYVTCSVLPDENEDQVAAYLGADPAFASAPFEAVPAPHHVRTHGVQFTPLKTGCDGFYVARVRRVRA